MRKICSVIIVLAVLINSCLYVLAASDNLIQDAGFETGIKVLWDNNDVTVVNNNVRSGAYALHVPSNNWTFYIISGLMPNTKYKYTAWVKTDSATGKSYVGVKNYGGGELMANSTGSVYTQMNVTFTTGASSTSAMIYIGNGGGSTTYADDLALIKLDPISISSLTMTNYAGSPTNSIPPQGKFKCTVAITSTLSDATPVTPIIALYDADDHMIQWNIGDSINLAGGDTQNYSAQFAAVNTEDTSGYYVIVYVWESFTSLISTADSVKFPE